MYNFSCNITIVEKQKKNEHSSSENHRDSTTVQPAAVTEGDTHLQMTNGKVHKTKDRTNVHKKKKHLKYFEDHTKVENLNDSLENVCFNENGKTDFSESKKHKKIRKHSPEHEFSPRDSCGNETSLHYDTNTVNLPKTDVNESKKHKKRKKHSLEHEFPPRDSCGKETFSHYDTNTEDLPKNYVNECKIQKHKKKVKHSLEHEFPSRESCDKETFSHYDTNMEDLPKTDVNESKKHNKRKKHSLEHEFPSRDSCDKETFSHYDRNTEDLPGVSESRKHKKKKLKHSPEHEFLSRDAYRKEISSHYDTEQESSNLQNFTKKKKKRHLITPDAIDIQHSQRDKKRKGSEFTNETEDLSKILSPHHIKKEWEALANYDEVQDSLNFQNFTKKKKKRHLEITPDAVDIQNSHSNENVDLENIVMKKRDKKWKGSGSTNATEDFPKILSTHDIKRELEALTNYDQVQVSSNLQNFTKKKKKRHLEITPDAVDVQNSDPDESVNSEYLIKDSNKKRKDSGSTNGTEDLPETLLPHEIKMENDDASQKKQQDIKLETLTNYDEVQDYLDLKCVRQRLSEDHKTMLRQLHISLPWPVPATHLIETRMSSHPTQDQKKRFQELAIPMKTSHYSPMEDKILVENWKYFCKVHHIPTDPEPFLSFEPNSDSKISGSALPKLERINFVRFLGHKLEHRYLFSIYRRFKNLFSQVKKGRFSEAESRIILEYVKKSRDSNPFASLAHVLNRDRHTILMRYKTLGRLMKEGYKC